MTDLEKAEAALTAASRALDYIEQQIGDDIAKVADAIRAKYKPELILARERYGAAHTAAITARDKTPDHPWTGKRVFRIKQKWNSSTWRHEPPVREDGIVEMRRSTTRFPGNIRSLPLMGTPFVRLLKKDGTPALRFEEMHSRSGWQLVEGAAEEPREAAGGEA
jgi:hypothetical protein